MTDLAAVASLSSTFTSAALTHSPLLDQALAAGTGLLLLSAVLQLWRRSLRGSISLLAVQGIALAIVVATVGALAQDAELVLMALVVLLVKAVVIPAALVRTAALVGATQETAPRVNPTAGLLLGAGLTTVAYLTARPLVGADPSSLGRFVPVGLALVFLGFLILLTRRQALSQVVGFVVLDNGIAAMALLTSGGVPFVVEVGVVADVLLVVLILTALTVRMRRLFGGTDLADLTELRD